MLLQIDKLGKVAVTVEEDYWSINKDYDKLTIVEQKDVFGTFISRKPVPAGTVLTDRKYWIPFSSLKEEIVLQFGELVNRLNNLDISIERKEEEIYKAMASLTAGGLVLKQSFGDSEVVGISQKVITEKVDDLQDQINKLHPGTFGISISAIPNLIYEDIESNVTIKVKMTDNSIADSIKIKIDENVVAESVNISELETTEILTKTTTIYAEAIQEGLSYENNTKVISTRPYYVGSGSVYTEIINDVYKQSIKANPNGTYNVVITTPQTRVFFVIPQSMTINKATMSGFTFPLDSPQSVIVDGAAYKVYQSSNTYDTGTLTIVIS